MDRKLAIYELLARCMRAGFIVGLDLRPPAAPAAEAVIDLDLALSKLPPAHRCYCGCQ